MGKIGSHHARLEGEFLVAGNSFHVPSGKGLGHAGHAGGQALVAGFPSSVEGFKGRGMHSRLSSVTDKPCSRIWKKVASSADYPSSSSSAELAKMGSPRQMQACCETGGEGLVSRELLAQGDAEDRGRGGEGRGGVWT